MYVENNCKENCNYFYLFDNRCHKNPTLFFGGKHRKKEKKRKTYEIIHNWSSRKYSGTDLWSCYKFEIEKF